MDNDKIERTIEIILQNQAQFYADMQMIQEAHKESEKRISVLERATVNLFNAITKTNETVDRLSEKIDKLADAQKETDENFRKTDERFRETDERLNAVIVMAEKFFSRQNGNSEN
jgi:chromosome segregation ATPase